MIDHNTNNEAERIAQLERAGGAGHRTGRVARADEAREG